MPDRSNFVSDEIQGDVILRDQYEHRVSTELGVEVCRVILGSNMARASLSHNSHVTSITILYLQWSSLQYLVVGWGKVRGEMSTMKIVVA